MNDQLLKRKRLTEGPGIQVEFYLLDQKVRQVVLSLSSKEGIELEIWFEQPDNPLVLAVEKWMDQYAVGKDPDFKLPLYLDAFPTFTKSVLLSMQDIAFGQICTYGDLARRCESPRAARAVGSVCRKNPFPLVVPCHRVIDSSQKLCGYSAGGGLEMKKRLLDHEEVYL